MATGESKTKWAGNGKGIQYPELPEQQNDIVVSYSGKRDIEIILATEPADVQTVLYGSSSKLTPNRLYYGDNLPILARLYRDQQLKGQIRLIYIDPPFSTNSVFKARSQQDAYHDLLVGAQYLEFMRERFIFLRDLLADDGSIYIHIDDTMVFHVKVILDEIFGRRNFRNFITRRKCNPKNYTQRTYGNISDYLLFYTKSDKYVWNRPVEEWTQERAAKEYTYVEPETGRRYKKVPIHAPGTRNGETGKPWRGKNPPLGKHWQFRPDTLDEMDEKGEIVWSANGNPRRKIYLDNSPGVPIQDIWWDMRDAHNQNVKITGYPTEKNPDLLRRIINASSNPGDWVLDCFSGSGTTLAVASELNRRWVGIDSSLTAIETTLKRFAHGLEPMGDFVDKRQVAYPMQLPLALPSEPVSTLVNDFVLFAAEPAPQELSTIANHWYTLLQD